VVIDDWYRRRSAQIPAATLLGMKPTIAIVDGRRVVWYPEFAIPDVLDAGKDVPSPKPDWEKMFQR